MENAFGVPVLSSEDLAAMIISIRSNSFITSDQVGIEEMGRKEHGRRRNGLEAFCCISQKKPTVH
jgi:hypothetical protein